MADVYAAEKTTSADLGLDLDLAPYQCCVDFTAPPVDWDLSIV